MAERVLYVAVQYLSAVRLRLQSRMVTFASIPSPSSSELHLGPLTVHAYGVCIAVAILAAVALANRRWTARGGTTDDVTALATWGVPAGIIGARIYHVVTDNELYRDNPLGVFAIWDGGLGIWGGIAGGVLAGLWVGRQRGLSGLNLLDMVAPALALGQAIGRIGNYFNQELFGRPTSLPWGLQIDAENRPAEYAAFDTFHPTFLYESLWNLGLAAVLILLDRRKTLRPGRIFVLYVLGYTFARFFLEGLRVDAANSIFGLRINEWTSLILFFLCLGLLLRDRLSKPVSRAVSKP